jgi:hypothetical protein
MSHLRNFKVGCHTGTIYELIDKYTTVIPELSIDLFLQVDNANALEKRIRDTYKENIVDQSGWYSSIRLIDLTTFILHNATGISDKEMFHYKLKTHNSDPLDKFILELRYNTANDIREEVIYVEPRKNLDLNEICNMYSGYLQLRFGKLCLLRINTHHVGCAMHDVIPSLHKLSLKERLKKHGYKSDNDDVLPGKIIRESYNHKTRYKIKLGVCLWDYIL